MENLLLEDAHPKGVKEDGLPDEDLSVRGSLKGLDKVDADERRDKVVALSILVTILFICLQLLGS